EAARVQTFPDWFVFPEARTAAFKLIGNAVPPIVGEAVGDAISRFLDAQAVSDSAYSRSFGKIMATESDLEILNRLAGLPRAKLKKLPRKEFLQFWRTLLKCVPELHPTNALDRGGIDEAWPDAKTLLPFIARAKHRRYARSGWPVAFEEVGREAWR